MNILQRKKGAQQRQDLQRVQELYQELVSKTPKCVGTYMLEKTIGQGSFGKIKLAIHALTGHQVALKVIEKTHAHAVVREVEHWRRLNHPHIVRLYELLTTESKIYLAMEYASRGDLLLWVNKVGRPTLGDTRKWFRQTADAVAYLHRRNLVHRDLKLENILLDDQLDVKLIDFGFTREFDQRRMLESYCGSMAYAAPEMISGQRYSGPEADIWSLGVILYTLLCGRLPFDEDDPVHTNRKIVLGEYIIPDDIDPEAANLLKAMLQVRAKDRVDIERILAHPWLFRVSDTEADEETRPESLPKSPTVQSNSPYANGYGSGSGGRSLDQLSTNSAVTLAQSFAQSMPHIRAVPQRKGSAPNTHTDHLHVTPVLSSMSNGGSGSARSSTDSLEEGELMTMLHRVGINTKAMERSVRQDACDSLTALYHILSTRLRRRNNALVMAANNARTAPQLRGTTKNDGTSNGPTLMTRFNRSNPDDLSRVEDMTATSSSPPPPAAPPPPHSVDSALRKMSLPWLSFTSSSTNTQNSTNGNGTSALVNGNHHHHQAASSSSNTNGDNDGMIEHPTESLNNTTREKERRSRSPNRLSTLFRDLRRRGTGIGSKERSPERHRWQQWSSDPTLTQRAREMAQMAQDAPPLPTSSAKAPSGRDTQKSSSGVPSIHVRHSSKDYGIGSPNMHTKAKDPRSRSIGDLRGVAEEHRRAFAASSHPMPATMTNDDKDAIRATGLTRSESERHTKRSSLKNKSNLVLNGVNGSLANTNRNDTVTVTVPSVDSANGTEHSNESTINNTSPALSPPASPVPIVSTSTPDSVATVPLPSWKLATSPNRSTLSQAFSANTMLTRRNLLNVVRSAAVPDERDMMVNHPQELKHGNSNNASPTTQTDDVTTTTTATTNSSNNSGDTDTSTTQQSTRSMLRPKATSALAMTIEEEEEEEE